MMNFHIDGLDRLSVSYAQLSQLSDEESWEIIEPAAYTLADKMRESISGLLRMVTGSLWSSIEVRRKVSKGGVVYALVGPNDKKHPKSSTGKRKSRGPKGGGGGSYAGTNAEVGWILEYGTSRIEGRHWMEKAVTAAEELLLTMLEAGFDALLSAAGF